MKLRIIGLAILLFATGALYGFLGGNLLVESLKFFWVWAVYNVFCHCTGKNPDPNVPVVIAASEPFHGEEAA